MTIRTKRGRVAVVSPPTGQDHGRRLATTPAVRTRLDPGDPAERLAFALVQAHLRRRGLKVGATERAIKARIERARVELRETPTGAEEARAVTSGLAANGGALLRTVERAAPDARDFATRAAVRFVALCREHAVTSTAALVSLASAAQWTALAELLRDECFALGATGEGLGERLKQAAAASTAGRLDLLGGLQLEREARDARPVAVPWLTSPVAIAPLASPTAPDPEQDDPDPETRPGPDMEDDGASADEGEANGGCNTGVAPPEPSPRPASSVGVGNRTATATVAPGRWDARGNVVPDGVAGPEPAALREMRKRGIDTSRWETKP